MVDGWPRRIAVDVPAHDGETPRGEGIGGVTVTPNAGTYYAVTSASGGYAIPVTMAAGTYQVTFSGNAVGTKNLTIGDTNVLLDLTSNTPVVYRIGSICR
jgi:hypothetical protein